MNKSWLIRTKYQQILLCCCGLLLLLSSCIREELLPCPPLQVTLGVKDKNYDNIYAASRMGLEELRKEDLPFKEYVQTLYYRLIDVHTGTAVYSEALKAVEGSSEDLQLSLPQDLPFGRYVLNAWGNVSDRQSLDHPDLLTLHPEGLSGDDLYLSNDTLVYDERHFSYHFLMKRVKGKLIVQVKNMPTDYRYSEKSLDDLFSQVDHEFHYSGNQTLHTRKIWASPDSILTQMMVAPSIHQSSTRFHLQLFPGKNAEAGKPLIPEDIMVWLMPNHLTILKYIYNPCCDEFKIYALINEQWEQVHTMDIN